MNSAINPEMGSPKWQQCCYDDSRVMFDAPVAIAVDLPAAATAKDRLAMQASIIAIESWPDGKYDTG